MRFAAAVVFVDDVDATMAFYERTLGFARKFYDPEYGFGELDTGSATLAFGSHACAPFVTRGAYERLSRGPAIEIAFTMDDVEAAFRKAVDEARRLSRSRGVRPGVGPSRTSAPRKAHSSD